MSEQRNSDGGTSLPYSRRTETKFRGFPEFRSNVLYCPKQFFTVVVPHSSVNCIRLVAYMLRKTLGWVDENGEPVQEQHEFSYRDLEQDAGVSHSRLPEALEDAVTCRFIRQTQKARVQTQGVRAQSAAYELCWDDNRYTDELEAFQGFYLQPTYLDGSGQTRLGRKNIPNVFFDYLVRSESRRVIRVVGTLLWYSIDWGKGGERRVTVRKSLRDLVELTQLERSNVVRALNEAEGKGYVERVERGVFDLSGKRQSSTTVYGIRWTSEYTYTYEGLAVEVTERSQKATQPVLVNAPKKLHGPKGATLPKSHTEEEPEHSQKATRNAPKKLHSERSQKATKRITNSTITNTSINNSSPESPALTVAVAATSAVEKLLREGFSTTVASAIGGAVSEEIITRQIELLPYRNASRNKLGLLRKAIEENWPAPEGFEKTTDVCSSHGRTFAAHFYAGYHGNTEAPVADASAGDASMADTFVRRLLTIESDQALVPVWGRQFGAMVSYRHAEKRQSFPALQPAIRQFGDEFFTRLKASAEAEREKRSQERRSLHISRFREAYNEYLAEEFRKHETERTPLFRELLREEEESLRTIRSNKFGLDTEALVGRMQSREARLERFERLLFTSEPPHDVLDFWTWDEKLNAERFVEEKL